MTGRVKNNMPLRRRSSAPKARSERPKAVHHVYILRCRNGDLYTGYTLDPVRRLEQHNEGKASKFTRSRLPVELVHLEKFRSKSRALSREIAIKQLARSEKMEIISQGMLSQRPRNSSKCASCKAESSGSVRKSTKLYI